MADNAEVEYDFQGTMQGPQVYLNDVAADNQTSKVDPLGSDLKRRLNEVRRKLATLASQSLIQEVKDLEVECDILEDRSQW